MRARAGVGVVFCLVFGLSSLAGCDQVQKLLQIAPAAKPPAAPQAVKPQGTPLATVNSDVITLEDFDQQIRDLKALGVTIETTEDKKKFLNDLILQELVYQEARARGIDKKKDVRKAIDDFKKRAMAQELVLDETRGINVEPSEVENSYKQLKGNMTLPTQASVREIVVATEAQAKDAMIALLGGADFGALARERSKAPSAPENGDLGFYDPKSKFDKFNEVVQTLEPGQFSQYFSGPDGYYIVKVEEKKGGAVPQLTETIPNTDPPMTYYDYIKEMLLEQKRLQRVQDLTDKLKRDAAIKIEEGLL
ncbi:MAG: peptidyl-prolyl cis-trans isomerase [Deltaproteobacteria bacterium]